MSHKRQYLGRVNYHERGTGEQVANILGKLVVSEGTQDDAKGSADGGEIAMCVRMVPENPKLRIALMAVKNCSKAISAIVVRHGKSPCFLQVSFLSVVGPDYPLLILPYSDGAENLECAF